MLQSQHRNTNKRQKPYKHTKNKHNNNINNNIPIHITISRLCLMTPTGDDTDGTNYRWHCSPEAVCFPWSGKWLFLTWGLNVVVIYVHNSSSKFIIILRVSWRHIKCHLTGILPHCSSSATNCIQFLFLQLTWSLSIHLYLSSRCVVINLTVNQQASSLISCTLHPSYRFSFIHYLSCLVIFTVVTSCVNEKRAQEAECLLFCK
jgi:hypothetical protein